jgi:hypothetical protein
LIYEILQLFFIKQSYVISVQVRPLKPNEDPLNGTQIYTIIMSLATVTAWCCNSFLQVWRS